MLESYRDLTDEQLIAALKNSGDPDGKIMDTIFLPVKDVTACCVHGNTLYITTAKAKKPRPDEPTAGGMYICEI